MARVNTKTFRDAQTGATATATATAPGNDLRWRVVKVSASFSDAGPTGGTLQIRSNGGTVLWELDVPAGGSMFEDFAAVGGLQCGVNETANAILSGATAAITAKVNLMVVLDQ